MEGQVMPMRMRVTVNPAVDRVGELRIATNLRKVLRDLPCVERDSDAVLRGIHRDIAGRAYFEFITSSLPDVRKVIEEGEFAEKVDLTESTTEPGEECVNCGNVAGPTLPTVCPNCHFRDVSPCPMCGQQISREDYIRLSGDLFRCPNCDSQVRLRFNSPMFLPDGSYNPPLVVVEDARTVHAVR
jgi:predicted RNA-binding Zn-ribbon protein involved in translation (DUF1610 family)